MAGCEGEMTYMPFFENCILTCERRAAAEARYAEYSSSGNRLLCCIDITDYPSAFLRSHEGTRPGHHARPAFAGLGFLQEEQASGAGAVRQRAPADIEDGESEAAEG